MSRRKQPSLRLLSLNVNGLRDPAKRRTLFNLLHRDQWDVVLLQETHHSSAAEGQAWAEEGPNGLRVNWAGPSFWSHYSTQSCGVAVLISPRADVADIDQRHNSTDGRTLSIDFTFCGGAFTAVSAYAPSTADQRVPYFTRQLPQALTHGRQLLLGGDWNCIAEQLDILDPAGAPGARITGYFDGLRLVETDHQLYDVWRDRHPDRRTFTHLSAAHGTAARLDRWLVSEQTRPWVSRDVSALGQTAGYPGDHLGVALRLSAPGGTHLGSAAWRLPLHLLDDDLFVEEVTALIPAFLQEHPLSAQLSRGQRWVHLKQRIRAGATARSFALAAHRRAEQRANEAAYRAALARYEADPTDAEALFDWTVHQGLLQASHTVDARTASLQAGVLWQHYGETSTFWFHHLARERRAATSIAALRAAPALDAPVIPLDSPEHTQQASTVLTAFYSGDSPTGLFQPPEVSRAAQQQLLAAVDLRLSLEDSAKGEGPAGDGSISEAELAAAVKAMPRGKSPGFDGLPYEFYQRFWAAIGPELCEVLQSAFTDAEGPGLPPDMLEGRITLLYKGKGADRAQPASYRPITLLNTDYKLAARVIASRMGPLLNSVVDNTQTGFLPQRWIGDNVLAHLEEIAYHEDTGLPGVILFLDFEKAFDRLDRDWIEQCMAAVGFAAGSRRWVHLLHSGTTAKVAFNGWHTSAFPVRSGVFQGSPLSPLLFTLAAQPMAAHVRRTAAEQGIQPLSLPSGAAVPFIHQHADDTTLHARSPQDAHSLLTHSVDLHCSATGSRLQRSKSQGLGLGAAGHLHGLEPVTGITFAAPDASVRHLGIPLARDAARAADELFTRILGKLRSRIARWSGFRLSLLGRAYVAKQVLVSMFTYHATFIPIPAVLLRDFERAIYTFVAANRPVLDGQLAAAALYPSRETSARDSLQGGIGLVHIQSQLCALQAKIISRLLEPEPLAWKAFFDRHLFRDEADLVSRPQLREPGRQHVWRLGRALLFSSFPVSRLDAPPRALAYISAFMQLGHHRLVAADALPFQEIMSQPLFHNPRIRDSGSGASLAWHDWALQGLVRIRDLRSLRDADPGLVMTQQIQRLLSALPAAWRDAVIGADQPAMHLVLPDCSDRRVWTAGPHGQILHTHTASPSGLLLDEPAAPSQAVPPGLVPALIIDWDPDRPWHPRHRSNTEAADDEDDAAVAAAAAQPSTAVPHLLGAWQRGVVDPHSWGLGSRPSHQFVVKEAAARRRLLHRLACGSPQAAQPLRPPIWGDTYGDAHSGLRRIEMRWQTEPEHAAPGAEPDYACGGNSWLRLEQRQPPRASPADRRALQRQRTHAAPQPVPDLSAAAIADGADDSVDRAAAAVDGASTGFSQPWRAIADSGLDRKARVTAWRLLHGQLFVGAFQRQRGRHALQHTCPCAACQGQLATLTHVMLTCPTAAPVWQWFAAIWAAITAAAAPPISAELLLADDRRQGWQPEAAHLPLWHRIRLMIIREIYAAYMTALLRPGAQHSAAHTTARVITACRELIRRDWLIVGTDFRRRAGVVSDWLRGRQPQLSAAAFAQRWCHGSVLCDVGDAEDPQLTIHWTAQHPVQLPH